MLLALELASAAGIEPTYAAPARLSASPAVISVRCSSDST